MRGVHTRLAIAVLAIAVVVTATTTLARPGQATQPDRVRAQPVIADDAMRVASVPIGAKLDLRLQTLLDSASAKADERFDAATLGDYSKDGRVLVPAATPVKGFVGSVLAATGANRSGSLTLSFEEIRFGDRAVRLRASVEQLFKGQPSDVSARVGADAAIGAAISRLPGGGQGSFVGVLVGPGGSIASTEATDVKLPVGTILRIRIDRPIEIVMLPAR